ncbi:Nucleolar protein 58, partial [Coemansia sp. RSA 2603]
AISLLDDLDKELNTYAMSVKEWYGWHFPEMAKIINDNLAYAKVIKKAGFRTNIGETDLGEILPEELEAEIKEAAEISMGTEISDEDLLNVTALCDQVISITEYRTQLYEYLKNRMFAIAPNLTALVGELVGARLISHAGSLMTLAKYPASTIQILGAEKAGPKAKGKIARLTATKASIAVRVDALGDTDAAEVGIDGRVKVEARLRQLEGRFAAKAARADRAKATKFTSKFEKKDVSSYNAAADVVMTSAPTTPVVATSSEKKRKVEEADEDSDSESEKKSKKDKKEKYEKKEKQAKSKDKEAKKEKKDKKEKSKDKEDKKEKKSKKNKD